MLKPRLWPQDAFTVRPARHHRKRTEICYPGLSGVPGVRPSVEAVEEQRCAAARLAHALRMLKQVWVHMQVQVRSRTLGQSSGRPDARPWTPSCRPSRCDRYAVARTLRAVLSVPTRAMWCLLILARCARVFLLLARTESGHRLLQPAHLQVLRHDTGRPYGEREEARRRSWCTRAAVGRQPRGAGCSSKFLAGDHPSRGGGLIRMVSEAAGEPNTAVCGVAGRACGSF